MHQTNSKTKKTKNLALRIASFNVRTIDVAALKETQLPDSESREEKHYFFF